MQYDEGTRVTAPDYDGVVMAGIIVDNCSVMCYIRFDDGTEAWCFKADRNFNQESK